VFRWVHRKAEEEPRCFSIVASSPTLRGARLGAASAKLFARHTTRMMRMPDMKNWRGLWR
jgi:hypothetical protein